jgi:benzodiazapine receptor
MNARTLAILNLLSFAGVIAVNTMANVLPINGMNTGEISALYPNRFVPAGFTFGIWSVIYGLMAGFTVLSVKWLWNVPDSPLGRMFQDISPLFIATCILNAAWIFVWHHLMVGLSVAIMLAFLLLLVRIHQRLQGHRSVLKGTASVFVYTFFTVYLGWISVATIANVTAWLVSVDWKGLGIAPEGWSMTMMATAILLGILFIRFSRDHAYAWVIAWALFGIHGSQSAGSYAIGQLALGGIAILFLYSAFYLYMDRPRNMA